MRYAVCAGIALVFMTLPAQTAPARPQFDVASVRLAASDGSGDRAYAMLREVGRDQRRPDEIPMSSPDRVRLQDWTLLDLIAAAYSVRATQVSGPAWLSDLGFDVEATVPESTPKAELNAMLQSLLEERFGLAVHRAQRTEQGFALVVGRHGPKLTPAGQPPAPAQGLTEEERKAQVEQKIQAGMEANRKHAEELIHSGEFPGGFNAQTWPSITTEDLAAWLVRFVGAPVVDETGLSAKYSVDMVFSKNTDAPGGTVFDAVEKLGLRLKPRKVTVGTVVVDHVSKLPTAN